MLVKDQLEHCTEEHVQVCVRLGSFIALSKIWQTVFFAHNSLLLHVPAHKSCLDTEMGAKSGLKNETSSCLSRPDGILMKDG